MNIAAMHVKMFLTKSGKCVHLTHPLHATTAIVMIPNASHLLFSLTAQEAPIHPTDPDVETVRADHVQIAINSLKR